MKNKYLLLCLILLLCTSASASERFLCTIGTKHAGSLYGPDHFPEVFFEHALHAGTYQLIAPGANKVQRTVHSSQAFEGALYDAFLAKKPDLINLRSGYEKFTLAMVAVRNGELGYLEKLLKKYPDLDLLKKDASGHTIFDHAAASSWSGLVFRILEQQRPHLKATMSQYKNFQGKLFLDRKLVFLKIDSWKQKLGSANLEKKMQTGHLSALENSGILEVSDFPVTERQYHEVMGYGESSAVYLKDKFGGAYNKLKVGQKEIYPNLPINLKSGKFSEYVDTLNKLAEENDPRVKMMIEDHQVGDQYVLVPRELNGSASSLRHISESWEQSQWGSNYFYIARIRN